MTHNYKPYPASVPADARIRELEIENEKLRRVLLQIYSVVMTSPDQVREIVRATLAGEDK